MDLSFPFGHSVNDDISSKLAAMQQRILHLGQLVKVLEAGLLHLQVHKLSGEFLG